MVTAIRTAIEKLIEYANTQTVMIHALLSTRGSEKHVFFLNKTVTVAHIGHQQFFSY